MEVVGDTADVEMKEERRSRRSSHPYACPVGGACTKPDSRSADQNGKQKKTNLQKNLKQIACVSLFLLQVTVKATTGREEKRGGNRSRPPFLRGFLQWRVNPRTATVQMPRNLPATVPAVTKGLPCNSCRVLGFIL
jgi:hypothetical protein